MPSFQLQTTNSPIGLALNNQDGSGIDISLAVPTNEAPQTVVIETQQSSVEISANPENRITVEEDGLMVGLPNQPDDILDYVSALDTGLT